MKRLSVLIVVLGMSQTAFAAPPGAVKKKFVPENLSQEEAGLWQTAPHDPSTIRALADWLSERGYAFGEILQLLVFMQDLAYTADKIEYLRGEDLTRFLEAQHEVRGLVQQYEQELLAMMAGPRMLGVYNAADWTYFAVSDLYLYSLNSFEQLAELQGHRHLVHRLTAHGNNFFNEEHFIRAFDLPFMGSITELQLVVVDKPDLFEALVGFLAKNPELLPHLRVLHLVGVPAGFSLGDFGTSALGQQLHTLTLEAGVARYHFDSLVKEIGRPGSFKSLTGLHLLPLAWEEGWDNVTAAGLKQLRSASFRLTHLTFPRITTGNKASIPANLFGIPCLKRLKELTMDVTMIDPAALMRALGGLKHLEVWDISGSKVPPDFWNAVVGSQVYQRLLSLIAQRTHMDDSAVAIVGRHPSQSLLFLDVRLNPGIGKEGYAALASAAFPSLTTLGVGHANSSLTLKEIRQILADGDGLPALQTIIRQGFYGGVKQFVAVSHSGPPIVFSGNVTQLLKLPGTGRDQRGWVTISTNCPGTFSEAG